MVFLLRIEIDHKKGEYEHQDACDDTRNKTKHRAFDSFISEHPKNEWSSDHKNIHNHRDEVNSQTERIAFSIGMIQSIPNEPSRIEIPPSASG